MDREQYRDFGPSDPHRTSGPGTQTDFVTLTLTRFELAEIRNLLHEEQIRIDDDGNEGAFDASPLKLILNKVRRAAQT